MIGVVFADEGEAKTFYKKVSKRKADSGVYFFLHNSKLSDFRTRWKGHESLRREEERNEGEDRQIHDLRSQSRVVQARLAYGV